MCRSWPRSLPKRQLQRHRKKSSSKLPAALANAARGASALLASLGTTSRGEHPPAEGLSAGTESFRGDNSALLASRIVITVPTPGSGHQMIPRSASAVHHKQTFITHWPLSPRRAPLRLPTEETRDYSCNTRHTHNTHATQETPQSGGILQ